MVSFQLSNRNVPCSAATGGGLGLGAFGLRGISYMREKCDSSDADRCSIVYSRCCSGVMRQKNERAGRHAHSVQMNLSSIGDL
eukprot:COSAG01_NODE_1265_length_10990_cov_23.579745_2_plen_83_part_00